MKLSAAIREFLRFCAVERRFSEHTLQAYECDLADFLKYLPAGANTGDATERVLQRYLHDMVGKRKLSQATVCRRFACLRGFFRRLAAQGDARDPLAAWRPSLPRRKGLPRALSRAEVGSLLSSFPAFAPNGTCMPDPGFQAAINLMVGTGIRVGELCKLRIEDVSHDGSMLRISGKGSRDRIAYVADDKLRRDICRLVQCRRKAGSKTGPMFLNRHRSQMKPQSIRAKLRKHADSSGIARRVTPHMLRHTAATLLIETGVDIRFVQRVLGHASIATTEIYTHVSDEALRTTLQRADILGAVARQYVPAGS